MAIDKNARYLESHEYAKPEGELMVIGISDHAQAELGDVVFIEFPAVGKELDKGVVFGTIESVKAASDLYMPISGKVVEVNEEVKNDPSLVNKDCYGSGWLIKVAPSKLSEFESLLDAESYGASIGRYDIVSFVPHTDLERAEMLKAIGIPSIEDLFSDIPEHLRIEDLALPESISEIEAIDQLETLASRNVQTKDMDWFLGAGAYYSYIPAVVPALAGRGEFLTAYTPYQPEVSQGTLQAIFEYQSMTAKLLGMSVVNASHYDGATALAEAVLMAWKARENRNRIFLPKDLHPEYSQVISTYCTSFDIEFIRYEGDPGQVAIDEDTAAIVVAYPGFSGQFYPVSNVSDKAHEKGALCIVQADPLMCAIFKSPGEQGADIVTAEGQCLGNPLNFGGPYLGMMGTTDALIRRMPGRIVGQTKDKFGKRGFVLTLSTREQHIRREKAVSNICSNQGLSMLQTCIYLATLGKNGLQKVARLSYDKAHYAAQLIDSIPGYHVVPKLFFREFLVETPDAAAKIVEALNKKGIVPGLALSRYYPERKNELLICVTEMNTKAQIEKLAVALKEAAK